MIDKTKAIITLVLAIIALIVYANRLEHRLTVMEQRDIRIEESIDDIAIMQMRISQHLFFSE